MRRPSALLLMAVPLPVLAGTLALVLLRTQHRLDDARTTASAAGRIPFELRALDPTPRQTSFEPVAGAPGFSSGIFFRGLLYLTGPAGLYVYSGATPELLHLYRTGIDLPAARLGAMAIGTLRGESSPVLAIATSGEGVLLFSPAPASSASAFAGGSFRQLRPASAEMRDITALLALPTGELLLGTRRAGLLNWSAQSLALFRPEMASVPITALAADAKGGLWIGTRDRGVLRWSGGTVEPIGVADGLPDDQVESLLVPPSRPGVLFAGTPVGVAELRDGKVARRIGEGAFAHALGLSSDGKSLEIGTLEEGVLDLPLASSGSRRAISAAGALGPAAQSAVAALFEEGAQLFAVSREGVRRIDPKGPSSLLISASPSALTDGNISALAFAPDGRLWVGYFDHGLDILPSAAGNGGGEHLEDDAVFCVNRLLLDARPGRNSMVAATANGLVLFDAAGRERQVLTRRDGLISDHVTDVAATRRGLAVATPAGLTFIDADATSSLYGFEGLVNNHVYAIAVQPDSDLMLAGTLGGVSLLGGEAVRRNLTLSNSTLGHNWITAAVAMPGGGWMVGTYGAGIERLDSDGQFTPMEGANILATQQSLVVNPNALLATPDHVLAGTLGEGMWVYSRATQRWTRWTRGLPSENVTAFAERDGQIYVGTENGLVRIAERTLEQGGGQ